MRHAYLNQLPLTILDRIRSRSPHQSHLIRPWILVQPARRLFWDFWQCCPNTYWLTEWTLHFSSTLGCMVTCGLTRMVSTLLIVRYGAIIINMWWLNSSKVHLAHYYATQSHDCWLFCWPHRQHSWFMGLPQYPDFQRAPSGVYTRGMEYITLPHQFQLDSGDIFLICSLLYLDWF